MTNIIRFPWKSIDIKFDKKECYLDEEDKNNLLKEGQHVWQCACSCHTFFILPDRMVCSNCGAEPTL
ncbi:MAG TPA: hypothetical protein VGD14_09455 [bacterium]